MKTTKKDVNKIMQGINKGLWYRHVNSDVVYKDKFPIAHAILLREFTFKKHENNRDKDRNSVMIVHKKTIPDSRVRPFLNVKPCCFKLTDEFSIGEDLKEKNQHEIFATEYGSESILFIQFADKKSHFAEYLQSAILKAKDEFYGSKDGKEWECLTRTGIKPEKCKELLFDEEGFVKDGIIVYNYPHELISLATSNGMLQQRMTMLIAENEPGFDVKTMREKLWLGMDREILHYAPLYPKDDSVPKKISQLSTRVGQVFAPCLTTIPLRSFAIYCGKIKDSNDFEFCDGEGLVSARFFAEALSEASGEEVTTSDCVGVHGQMRPYSCKGKLFAVTDDMMTHIVTNTPWTKDDIEVVTISRDQLSEYSRHINDALELKQGPLVGKVLVILDDGESVSDCGIFVDFNVIKAPVDWTTRSGLNIMKVSHGYEGVRNQIHTSSQLLANLVAPSMEKSLDIIHDASRDAIAKIARKYAMKKGKPLGEDYATMDIGLATQQVNPAVAHVYAPFFKTIFENDIEGLQNNAQDAYWEIDGLYVYVTSDIGKWFGASLLEEDEVYCRGLLFADVKKAMLKKYPAMHMQEYHSVKTVTAGMLLQRALVAGLSTEAIRFIAHYIDTLAPCTVMIGDNPSLLHLLAGMDFDGDSISIVTDERAIEIIEEYQKHPQKNDFKLDPLAVTF